MHRRRSAAGIAGRKCRSSARDGGSTARNPVARSPDRRPGSASLGIATRIDRHRLQDHRVDRAVTSSGPHLGDLIDYISAGLISNLAEEKPSITL